MGNWGWGTSYSPTPGPAAGSVPRGRTGAERWSGGRQAAAKRERVAALPGPGGSCGQPPAPRPAMF
jgi:hypothetical protein